ncbi:MAG: nitrilase-related carbon-nitrogen hydrolase [Candidatus Hodarchaeales archaeon]|jgi:N-carbamoylputrescine amidase
MKIALIQQHATRNKDENIQRGIAALEEAATQGAELVAFPELAFERFWPQKPATKDFQSPAEPVPGPITDIFMDKARELGVVVVLNLFERDNGKTFDCSPVISSDGELLGKTRMVHILEAPCFHEKGYYTPGNLEIEVYNTAAGRIGVAICYDRHFPEYMRILALKGADLVIVPQAGAVDEWPPGIFEAELQVAAFQNGYFTALANRVGEEDCIAFAGESFITNPEGRVIARAPKETDSILYAVIDYEELNKCPARNHFLADRRPETYSSLLKRGNV